MRRERPSTRGQRRRAPARRPRREPLGAEQDSQDEQQQAENDPAGGCAPRGPGHGLAFFDGGGGGGGSRAFFSWPGGTGGGAVGSWPRRCPRVAGGGGGVTAFLTWPGGAVLPLRDQPRSRVAGFTGVCAAGGGAAASPGRDARQASTLTGLVRARARDARRRASSRAAEARRRLGRRRSPGAGSDPVSGLRARGSRAAGDPVDLLLHDRDAWKASEAEHPEPEPDHPEAGEESGRECDAPQQARAAAVRGDEDRALGPGGDSFSFDDCHRGSLRLKDALHSAREHASFANFAASLRLLPHDCVAQARPGLLRPVAELEIRQHAEGQLALGIDPDERPAPAPVAERARRGERAREVRLLASP